MENTWTPRPTYPLASSRALAPSDGFVFQYSDKQKWTLSLLSSSLPLLFLPSAWAFVSCAVRTINRNVRCSWICARVFFPFHEASGKPHCCGLVSLLFIIHLNFHTPPEREIRSQFVRVCAACSSWLFSPVTAELLDVDGGRSWSVATRLPPMFNIPSRGPFRRCRWSWNWRGRARPGWPSACVPWSAP